MSVTAPEGFVASGVAAGIKDNGDLDLSLVASANGPVPAAAVFTTNRAAAAPVQISTEHLKTTNGHIGAVVLNSGCANAATGEVGYQDAKATCNVVAGELKLSPEQILVCSTGLIGRYLPTPRLLSAVPGLARGLGESPEHGLLAARAIMTTDTHPKQVLVANGEFSVGGMAKGSGMIAPNMATMLAILTTDAAASPEQLGVALRVAVDATFNALVVDGCTSTNDTVALLASGLAGPIAHRELVQALSSACEQLAYQLAQDAEGASKLVNVHVEGATSDEAAKRAARSVASSLLVKTSWYGGDPYWGRIVSELGASGAPFAVEKVAISYGGITVCENGIAIDHDRAAVAVHMAKDIIEITCSLGLGTHRATVITTDLGHGYIDENMRTS